MSAAATDSFPRRSARTQRFTLGQPRAFTSFDDGAQVLFLRSRAGDDAVTCLWVLDVEHGEETLLVDPRDLLGGEEREDLPPEEAARRERLREGAGGIVAYATDTATTLVAFALGGRLWATDLPSGRTRPLSDHVGVIDPRPSPDGRQVAFVSGGALHVVSTAPDAAANLAALVGPSDDEPDVTWGLAEFAAAEEMGRFRGFWWSPGSDALLVARVDESPVPVWHVADPANPDREPRPIRYPAAGTQDAEVTLWLVGLDGTRTPVDWDRDAFPYLTSVSWPTDPEVAAAADRRALIQVMSRSQQRAQILTVTSPGGTTTVLRELSDDTWIELTPGSPTWGSAGELLTVEPHGDAHRLCVDGTVVSSSAHQVRSIAHVDAASVVVSLGLTDDPAQRLLAEWTRWKKPGDDLDVFGEPDAVNGYAGGVRVTSTWTTPPVARAASAHGERVVASFAQDPQVEPVAHLLRSPGRDIPTAVFLPTGHEAGSRALPVLMSPYGGPHAQRVLAARGAHLESQWLADQGFAVVVADGRGTPRTPSWERAVRLDLATPALEDQVEALHAAAEAHPDLDLDRVAIRGWSFGGYLAALAVLRRPDVFHAAVAGAPVTDWRLYDTYYTERYLGHPDEFPDAYACSSLLDDAPNLTRSLMLIHGLADDNVVAAHTLRLSSALLAAGKAHTVLPLSGVTHMTPQEVVAENLLLLQLDFLRTSLTPRTAPSSH